MVGVQQQSVSRWEKGVSRPRNDYLVELACALKTELGPLEVAAGYMSSLDNNLPVRPLLYRLPLASLNAEGFELFCHSLLSALHPGADVSRFGGQGDTQDGIDLFVKNGNSILAYQCKRHAQFGPADVKKVISTTTFKAEHHHLLLSRQATAAARKAILDREDWSLWDVEDISLKVRELPQETSLRIVRAHFPGLEKDFLGVEGPSPWLTSEEFFIPLANRIKIFSHDWSFVGRETELTKLNEFINSDERAIIISGRGGIGKSRLLRAFTQQLPSIIQTRFLSSSVEIKLKDFELLPKDGILLIDDAHENADIGRLINTVGRLCPEIKLVICTRPYGMAHIQSELTKSGYINDEVQAIKIEDLSVDDARKLSIEILSDNGGNVSYADQIAEETKDCPLATVIGSRLVASGRINPKVLNNSDVFRNQLFATYRNIVTGEVGGKDAEQVQELLDFVACIQPINPNDPAFENAAESILKRPYYYILRNLTELENAGVLLRRRNSLRIAPDLLADFIRAEAAYNIQNSRPTGFADRVFAEVKDGLATNLVVNLSQLDWRLSADGIQTDLLNRIWTNLETQFIEAGILTRRNILKTIEKVAYYQPYQVIKFVDMAISRPTDEVEDIGSHFFAKLTYDYVLECLPPILKYAGYNLEYIPQVFDLLRKLALDDKRTTNQYPNHPQRIMTELAMVEPGKPINFNERILNHVLGWLKKPWTTYFSPFDILDSLLATEGYQMEMKGANITYRPYLIRAKAVANFRKKIIDAAFETIMEKPLHNAIRGIKTIREALRGSYGRDVIEEDKDQWMPGQVDVLLRLKGLMENSSHELDPYISVEIREAVSWHAVFSKNVTRDVANAVLKAIPIDLIHEISRALADGFGSSFERNIDFKQKDECFKAWRIELADTVISEYKDNFKSLIELLEERISVLNGANLSIGSESGPFIGDLVHKSNEFGEMLCNYILKNLTSPLATIFGSALIALFENDYEIALSITEEGISNDNEDLLFSISWAVGWGLRIFSPVGEREAAIIIKLMESEHISVRMNTIRVVGRFPVEQRSIAIRMLLSMKYNDASQIANEVLRQFGKYGSFEVGDLSDVELDEIFSRLVSLNSIDDYYIENFLDELSQNHPLLLLKFLMNRVEYKGTHNNLNSYSPLLKHDKTAGSFCFFKNDKYEHLLRSIRNWTVGDEENSAIYYYGPDLFKFVSADFDEVTLGVLDEWIESPEEKYIEKAASLLSEAPRGFLWENYQYVIKLLELAEQHSNMCFTSVCSHLRKIAFEGVRSGAIGKPFQDDIELRDKFRAIVEQLPTDSAGYRFYKSLYDMECEVILRQTKEGEEILND